MRVVPATDPKDSEFFVGSNPEIRDIARLVQKIATCSATVLIVGESGTGKELVARLLHRESGRTGGPFITVNLAAIPQELGETTLFGHERGAFTGAHKQHVGKFEAASAGTLFLDEIGDARLDLQATLLRAIQEAEIERIGGTRPIRTNVRLVAATNVDLAQAVTAGRFRQDLYYRINVIPIRIPPLRDRIDDLPALAQRFVERYAAKFQKPVRGIAASALKVLSEYRWPGNIRELQNLIERVVAVSDQEWITEEDLSDEYCCATMAHCSPSGKAVFREARETFERTFLRRALEHNGWNVSRAARHLGLPLSTLKHMMGRLGVRRLPSQHRSG